jgi:hypothetical protein
MKQGDRVICKKSIDGYDTHFVSGKEYFIYETANNAVYIRFDYNQALSLFGEVKPAVTAVGLNADDLAGVQVFHPLSGGDGQFHGHGRPGRWFTIEMSLDWDNSAFKYDFKSHFYTKQEFRKMKLEKLSSL